MCWKEVAHSSLVFVGILSEDGSIVCLHSGALCAKVASVAHSPSKDMMKASAVARMLLSTSEDIMMLLTGPGGGVVE